MALDLILSPGEDIKPNFSIDDAKELLDEFFGLKYLKIIELNGYDDKNYKVEVKQEHENKFLKGKVCNDGYVLKIMNSLDSRNLPFVEGCNSLLHYLERKHMNSPKLVPTKSGQYYAIKTCNNKQHVVRLLEFIPGTLLYQIQPTETLLYQAGQFVAQLNLAMKEFHHSVYDTHKTIWHLDSVPKLTDFTFAIEDNNKKKIILDVIDEFKQRVLEVRDQLEPGMIHGDFNEQNILVDEMNGKSRIKAILDFGDSHYSCYLYELAIAMTYIMLLKRDIRVGGHVIAGYLNVKPISDTELLKICICARLCQSLVMSAYTYLQHPENLYLLTTADAGWELLTKLRSQTEQETIKTWQSIMEKYS